MKIDVWQKIWESYQFDAKNDLWELYWEDSQPRWKQAMKFFHQKWGGLKGRHVIEIGCGRATEALLAAREGASVTLVDINKIALNLAEKRFKYYGVDKKLQLIQSDVLKLDKKLLGKFDLCMSLGLAEHFIGINRQKVIDSHAMTLKPGGLAMISVPNRYSIPYRLWMKREQVFGKWPYGLELPYSPKELIEKVEIARMRTIFLMGSPTINDVFLLFIPPKFKRLRSLILTTSFDSCLGYILTALAQKTH